jgi:hypothetical protein
LLEDLVREPLSGRKHFGVVFGYQVLNELLKLLPVHLKQGF